jgi:hypothetical protein
MAKTWPWDNEGFTLENLRDVDLTGLEQGQTIILSGTTFIPGTAGGGTPGADGREVELQKGTTHIQWRYVGDTPWTDLVALVELKGDKGDSGGVFSGLAKITVGTTEPTTPTIGDLWIDTN